MRHAQARGHGHPAACISPGVQAWLPHAALYPIGLHHCIGGQWYRVSDGHSDPGWLDLGPRAGPVYEAQRWYLHTGLGCAGNLCRRLEGRAVAPGDGSGRRAVWIRAQAGGCFAWPFFECGGWWCSSWPSLVGASSPLWVPPGCVIHRAFRVAHGAGGTRVVGWVVVAVALSHLPAVVVWLAARRRQRLPIYGSSSCSLCPRSQ